MAAAENKALVHQFVEEVFNQRNFDAIDTYLSSDYVDHVVAPGSPIDRAGFKQYITMVMAAFPDFHCTFEDEIAEGDRTVQHVVSQATHEGDLPGLPATGKRATWSEIHIRRIANGQIVEHWGVIDQLGMLQQLGAVPMPESTGT